MNKTRLNRFKYTLCMGIPAIITYLGSKVLQRDTVECEMFLPWMIESSPIWFGAVVTDLVYTPLETRLLREARAMGCTVVDGLGMLLHQGAPGFERWFGLRPEVDDETRAVVLGS